MTENEIRSQITGIYNRYRKNYEDVKKDREKHGDEHYSEVDEQVFNEVMGVFLNILHEDFGVSYDDLGYMAAYPKKYPYEKEV